MRIDDTIAYDIFDAIEKCNIFRILGHLNNGLSIDSQDSIGCTMLYGAASYGHYDLAKLFLSHGANPNLPDANGITPLMEAASGGDQNIVELLIEEGASKYLIDNFGDTAYDYAIGQKYFKIAQILQ